GGGGGHRWGTRGGAAAGKDSAPPPHGARPGAPGGKEGPPPPPPPMRAERLGRDGDDLAARCRARCPRPVSDPARPGHVRLAADRALPERAKASILANGHPRLVVGDGSDAGEAV